MERINRTLGRLSRSPNFQNRYDQLKKEVCIVRPGCAGLSADASK